MIFVNAPVAGIVNAGLKVVACLRPGSATPAKVGPLKYARSAGTKQKNNGLVTPPRRISFLKI